MPGYLKKVRQLVFIKLVKTEREQRTKKEGEK